MNIEFNIGDLNWNDEDFDQEKSTLSQIMQIPTQQLVQNDVSAAPSRFSEPVSSEEIRLHQLV